MKSSSRNGAKVLWLGVHTTEGIMRATALRDWTGWAGSSHAASDETGALLTPADGFVPYDRSAWTLRNGNPISENIEQCGWARWTRAEWLARPLLLDATARWLADRSKARGIPLVKLSPAEVAARKPGVLGHGDYSTGTGDGTHWDPGPGYPWDVVLDKARTYASGTDQEDDMYGDQQRFEVVSALGEITGNTRASLGGIAREEIRSERILAALEARTVDADDLAKKVVALLGGDALIDAVAARIEGLTTAQVREALQDVLADIRVTIA